MLKRLEQQTETELIIRDPEINPDEEDVLGYSWRNKETRAALRASIKQLGITPFTHPLVMHFASGIGSLAKFFNEVRVNGERWPQANITCSDRLAPRNPLVKNAHWLFLDGTLLLQALAETRRLEAELEKHRGKYHVFVAAQHPWNNEQLQELAAFFLFPADPHTSGLGLLQPVKEVPRMKCVFEKDFAVIVRG